MLVIHGRPGEGKSWQLKRVLEDCGVETTYFNGSRVESEHAGDPAKEISSEYRRARLRSDVENGNPCQALILDDVDALLGNWGAMVQTTINRQLFIQELLKFADDPERIGSNADANRVPIFMTVNDVSKLYGPLVRSGRAKLFHWRPLNDEKIEVVRRMFPELDHAECSALVAGYPELAVADFAAIGTASLQEDLDGMIDASGYRSVFAAFASGAYLPCANMTPQKFRRFADELVTQRELVKDYTGEAIGAGQ